MIEADFEAGQEVVQEVDQEADQEGDQEGDQEVVQDGEAELETVRSRQVPPCVRLGVPRRSFVCSCVM
jgi:vacuolar-type H+-ATPase subunit H